VLEYERKSITLRLPVATETERNEMKQKKIKPCEQQRRKETVET